MSATSAEDYGADLFRELNDLFDRDPDIDELGLIVSPAESFYFGASDDDDDDDDDRKGVDAESRDEGRDLKKAFICEQHKLGITFACIPPLFCFAKAR
jgi:hypothetical protein